MTQIKWVNFGLVVLTVGGTALEEAITAHSAPPDIAAAAWAVHIVMAMLVAAAGWINANVTPTGKVMLLGKPQA